jgi:hypothetical protein
MGQVLCTIAKPLDLVRNVLQSSMKRLSSIDPPSLPPIAVIAYD